MQSCGNKPVHLLQTVAQLYVDRTEQVQFSFFVGVSSQAATPLPDMAAKSSLETDAPKYAPNARSNDAYATRAETTTLACISTVRNMTSSVLTRIIGLPTNNESSITSFREQLAMVDPR